MKGDRGEYYFYTSFSAIFSIRCRIIQVVSCSKSDLEISASLVSDVERDVSRRVYPSPSFLKLSTLDEHWSELCAEHSGHSKRCALIVDVGNFFRNRVSYISADAERSLIFFFK